MPRPSDTLKDSLQKAKDVLSQHFDHHDSDTRHRDFIDHIHSLPQGISEGGIEQRTVEHLTYVKSYATTNFPGTDIEATLKKLCAQLAAEYPEVKVW